MKFGIDTFGGRIDLNLLVVFDAIYGSRNLTAAGKQLGLSQPAMSHALGRLRLTFKDPLFVRLTRGLEPTSLADEIAPALIEGLEAIRGGLNRKRFDPSTSTRIFNIGMGDPAEATQLPILMREFRGSAPHIRLHTRQTPGPLLRDALANGEVDMATGDYDLGANVRSHRLYEAEYACVVGAEHPQIGNKLSLKQFKAAEHILVLPLGASQHGRNIERALQSRAVNARIAVQIAHFHGVLALITSTDLIATIPDRLAQAMARYANIKILPPPIRLPKWRLTLYWHERFHREPGNAWMRSEYIRLIK
ncbi:MAG: LysR family transcriptional regulator [Burkholderiales bacterium]